MGASLWLFHLEEHNALAGEGDLYAAVVAVPVVAVDLCFAAVDVPVAAQNRLDDTGIPYRQPVALLVIRQVHHHQDPLAAAHTLIGIDAAVLLVAVDPAEAGAVESDFNVATPRRKSSSAASSGGAFPDFSSRRK